MTTKYARLILVAGRRLSGAGIVLPGAVVLFGSFSLLRRPPADGAVLRLEFLHEAADPVFLFRDVAAEDAVVTQKSAQSHKRRPLQQWFHRRKRPYTAPRQYSTESADLQGNFCAALGNLQNSHFSDFLAPILARASLISHLTDTLDSFDKSFLSGSIARLSPISPSARATVIRTSHFLSFKA